MNNRTLFNRGIKVWKLIILWFSIKHYYMTYYLGFPSCPEYACMINDIEMREKNIVSMPKVFLYYLKVKIASMNGEVNQL